MGGSTPKDDTLELEKTPHLGSQARGGRVWRTTHSLSCPDKGTPSNARSPPVVLPYLPPDSSIPKRALKVRDTEASAAGRTVAAGSTPGRSLEKRKELTSSQDVCVDGSNTASRSLSAAEAGSACHSRIKTSCRDFSETVGSQGSIYAYNQKGQRVSNYFEVHIYGCVGITTGSDRSC